MTEKELRISLMGQNTLGQMLTVLNDKFDLSKPLNVLQKVVVTESLVKAKSQLNIESK